MIASGPDYGAKKKAGSSQEPLSAMNAWQALANLRRNLKIALAGVLAASWLLIAAGCGSGGSTDTPPVAQLPEVAGEYVLWELYGEEKEPSDTFIVVQQQGAELTIRDLLTSDPIGSGTVTPEGVVTINWIFEGAVAFEGQLLRFSTLASMPDDLIIQGIVTAADPYGLRAWWAQRTEHGVFAGAPPGQSEDPPVSGHDRIIAAGLLPYEDEQLTRYPETPNKRESAWPGGSLPREGTLVCEEQTHDEKIQAYLTKTIVATDDIDVYPGALLQGQGLLRGEFWPLAIPRAGGIILLRDLTVHGGGEVYRRVSQITASNVAQAINELLTEYPLGGTTADLEYETTQVYSSEQTRLALKAAFKGFGVQVDSHLNTAQSKEKNYFLVIFRQVFYSMGFEWPIPFEDVFRDGDNFVDRDGQIREGNPPVYVAQMDYGRQLFLLIETTETHGSVEAAINAAYSGVVDVSGGLERSHTEVMKNTNIVYWARGGAAAAAVKPIAAENMYEAVKKLIADAKAATYSKDNPGKPIHVTLKYLMTGTEVGMNMQGKYDKVDCYVEWGTPTWTFRYSGMNYRTKLWRDGTLILDQHKYGGELGGTLNINLHDTFEHDLSFTLSNGDCFSSRGDFTILKSGRKVWGINYRHGTSNCGDQLSVAFKYHNNDGGRIVTTFCEVYRGATYKRGETCSGL